MIKKDYIERIALSTGYQKKEVTEIVNQVFALMTDDLINHETITISNLGTFVPSVTKPIEVYSPKDGKLIKVEEQLRIHFKTSDKIKNSK